MTVKVFLLMDPLISQGPLLSGSKNRGVAECSGTTRVDRVFQAQQLIGFGRKKEELKIMLCFLIGRFC